MEFRKISLNGDWMMDCLDEVAPTVEAADFRSGARLDASDFLVQDEPKMEEFFVPNAIPAYWEDKIEDFSKTNGMYRKLGWNPQYTLQRYPQAYYVPDMCLPNVLGCLGYRRTFTVPSLAGVKEIRLFCGGAQNAVSAWINGHYIGRHEGYSASFFLTVPMETLVEGENRVTLLVSNTRLKGYKGRPVFGCTSRAANDCTGGVYGDLELRLYEGDLRDFWLTVDPDLAHFTVHTEGKTTVPTAVAIKAGGKTVLAGEIPSGENAVTLPTEGLSFWSPNNPYRYDVELSCGTQTLSRKCGIRCLTAEGTRLLLNGEYFYARGICEHGYYPLTVHPPRDKNYFRKVVRTLKKLGFNFVRFHTTIPMAEYMEAADELGILMEPETPNNTSYEEWVEIVHHCRRYTSTVMYSSGNEMVIDDEYIEHLRRCAAMVHADSDALFSPMSAMRGVEYVNTHYTDAAVHEPFHHDPVRLAKLKEFCDAFNAYSLGDASYHSMKNDAELMDYRQSVYEKPFLTHEICINGTYCDLSLADRYKGSRIGDTELFSSVERHLADKGVLDRAPEYYKASCAWQQLTRKHCFEKVRICETMAGYDFLGDIDHHWHTFGYCVGMMNEFYELKPGETVENVRRYNSDTVLLAKLPRCVNYEMGSAIDVPLLVSNYGKPVEKGTLCVRVADANKVYFRREIRVGAVPAGEITKLYDLHMVAPKSDKPLNLKLHVTLFGDETDAENVWDLYVFPKASSALPTKKVQKEHNTVIVSDIGARELMQELAAGKNVVLLGHGPFPTLPIYFQIALAGRTEGHLGVIVNDTPLMEDFPGNGYCGFQLRSMLEEGEAIALDLPTAPFHPDVELVSAYKNARREAMVFEYKVGAGKLFVCSLGLNESDPACRWLKERILRYVMSDTFAPKDALTMHQLAEVLATDPIEVSANVNEATNKNDITA
ncbi:MAG: hypothetical protein IJ009_00505 [Clostridia bacterium]|nr:hypothetical protein [Clostridia bacterium]